MKLNQLLVTEKSIKAEGHKTVTEVHHLMQKPALLAGISRRYQPLAEDGEKLPPEHTLVQLRVVDVIPHVQRAISPMIDAVLQKEIANQQARADIVVDDVVLVAGVPVCALLFMEKEVADLVTFVEKLPTLDPAERWDWDAAQNCWTTADQETHRTKKVPTAFTKAPATKEHPAQVEVVMQDLLVGYWHQTKFSGALPADRKAQLRERVVKLQQAIKRAREEANTVTVDTTRRAGDALLGWVFAK
jgi:hypothetical protein